MLLRGTLASARASGVVSPNRKVRQVLPFPLSNARMGCHAALVLLLMFGNACGSMRRSNESDASEDAGFDGSDTDLPWDTGTDTDVLVVEPVLISEFSGRVALASDGTHVAASWSDEDLEEPFSSDDYVTLFLTFPWETPEDVMFGSFDQDLSNCAGPYVQNMPSSQPYTHPDGFLLLTSTRGVGSSQGCEVVQTLWDGNANPLDGPNVFSGLFPDEIVSAMDPHGVVDEEGWVTTGVMNGVGFEADDDTDTDGTVVLDVDRWNRDGQHVRLTHAEFSWPYEPEEVAFEEIRAGFIGQSIFAHDGAYTVLSVEQMCPEGFTDLRTDMVVSLVDAAGGVILGPTRVENDVPPTPVGLEFTTRANTVYSFLSNGETVLEVAKTHYIDLEGYVGYEPSITNPFPIQLWSRVIDFTGEPLTEWVEMASYQSHVRYNWVHLAWSGRYFAACYSEPFDTFKLVVMDDEGAPISSPTSLFWPIPPAENKNFPCNLVAVDEDTFIVALGVEAEPPEEYSNGLWISRVDVSIPIE